MKIPGQKTADRFFRWLQARMLGGALILGYHRIDQAQSDSYGVCVSPEHFAEHLHALRKFAHPISLSRLVQHLREGSLPPRSVAITFDDGYVDNLEHAKPLLETYEIPATVFICTGYAGKEFWWDELERLVMTSQADGQALRLEVAKSSFRGDRLSRNSDAKRQHRDVTRRQLHRELYEFLLPLDIEDLSRALHTVRKWADLPSRESFQPRPMNHDELLRFADGGLIEVGAHTRNHLMLPRLSPERQREEIISAKRDLEDLLGRQVAGFSYPNGRATTETRWMVREAGFTYACTSLPDVVRPGTDLHALTRFWQENVDGDKFIMALNLWMKTRYIGVM